MKGPVIAIFGDTMPCQNEEIIADHANVMVHESTYIEGDKSLANNYHHSHIGGCIYTNRKCPRRL